MALIATEIRTKAPSTARTLRGVLSSFGSWGVERGYWPVSPLDGLRAPKVREGPSRALSALQMAKLWAAAVELDGVRSSSADGLGEDDLIALETAISDRAASVHERRAKDVLAHRKACASGVMNLGLASSHPREFTTDSEAVSKDGEAVVDGHRILCWHPDSTTWEAAVELDEQASGGRTRLDSEAARQGGLLAQKPPLGSDFNEPTEKRSPIGAAVSSHYSTTYRLILLLLGTGLRRSELANARWQDIEGDTLRVYGKGRKYRRVLIPPAALAFLATEGGFTCPLVDDASYQRGLGFEGIPPSPTQSSRPSTALSLQRRIALPSPLHSTILGLNSKTLYRRFKAIARKAGLPSVYPHQMRHTFATDMLRKGMSPLALQTLGGWADQRMVARYSKAALEDAALAEARRLIRL